MMYVNSTRPDLYKNFTNIRFWCCLSVLSPWRCPVDCRVVISIRTPTTYSRSCQTSTYQRRCCWMDRLSVTWLRVGLKTPRACYRKHLTRFWHLHLFVIEEWCDKKRLKVLHEKPHLGTTVCNLSHGITQCYLPVATRHKRTHPT